MKSMKIVKYNKYYKFRHYMSEKSANNLRGPADSYMGV